MSHCHTGNLAVNLPQNGRKIVLAGNPNVGKSVFFNAFTGLYVDVSNYPGTTLDISRGSFGNDVIIDTPGVYGVSSFNDEERVARDVILSADVVINVVDAVHLERDLFLTLQIIDMGKPVIVALNMVDEAKRQGIEVDADLLSHLLGVPVVPTVAVTRQGFAELKERIWEARPGHRDPNLRLKLNALLDRVGDEAEALMVLEGDENVAARHGVAPGTEREAIYIARRERVNDIVGHVQKETNQGASLSTRIGRMMIRPITGIPILLAALWLMYEIIGVFIAQTVVGITEEQIMQGIYEPAVRALLNPIFPQSSALGTILIGEFGVLTMTVTYVLGLMLPLVIGFYFMLSIFEDSGYLPRVATLVDRALNTIGLNGRGIIPIILGFGCVTAATITTRLLGSEREKRIAVFLLGLAIPCSAQLGVIAGLLATVGPKYGALYLGVIFLVLVVAGTLLEKLLPGESTPLLIDLPPVRMPRLDNVVKKTASKSYAFIKEATPLFALGALIIGGLQVTGLLETLQGALAPLTTGWLKLPREAATAFIMGFVRRDFGAAGLSSLPMTVGQTVVSMIVITLFVPCIASVVTIFKERGYKEAILMWLGSLAIAFLVGGIVAQMIV